MALINFTDWEHCDYGGGSTIDWTNADTLRYTPPRMVHEALRQALNEKRLSRFELGLGSPAVLPELMEYAPAYKAWCTSFTAYVQSECSFWVDTQDNGGNWEGLSHDLAPAPALSWSVAISRTSYPGGVRNPVEGWSEWALQMRQVLDQLKWLRYVTEGVFKPTGPLGNIASHATAFLKDPDIAYIPRNSTFPTYDLAELEAIRLYDLAPWVPCGFTATDTGAGLGVRSGPGQDWYVTIHRKIVVWDEIPSGTYEKNAVVYMAVYPWSSGDPPRTFDDEGNGYAEGVWNLLQTTAPTTGAFTPDTVGEEPAGGPSMPYPTTPINPDTSPRSGAIGWVSYWARFTVFLQYSGFIFHGVV